MPTDTKLRVYEAMFLVDTGDAAVWDDLTKHLTTILTRNGAEVIGITRWDERKLAYNVGKHKRGTYVLAFFCMASGAGVTEIEHDCSLSEKVVRTLILKADHFTAADMRQQLGEDTHDDVARKVMEARGEKEVPVAPAPVAAAAPASAPVAVAAKAPVPEKDVAGDAAATDA